MQADVLVEELVSGRMNYTFKASISPNCKEAFLIKSSPPFVKSFGQDVFPLTQARLSNEARAISLIGCSLAPKLILYSEENNTMIVEYIQDAQDLNSVLLDLPMTINRAESLILSFDQLGRKLAAAHFNHSTYKLGKGGISELHQSFYQQDILEGSLHVLFLDAFALNCPSNRYSDQLSDTLYCLQTDPRAKKAHHYLLEKYRDQQESLIHNDLHLGNILATPSSSDLHVIDWELARVGPIAADVGSLMGNLILAHACSRYSSLHSPIKNEWTGALNRFWSSYSTTFRSLLALPEGVMIPDQFIRDFWNESCGFAAISIIRLTVGAHHFPPLDMLIEENQIKASIELMEISRSLLCSLADSLDGDEKEIEISLSTGGIVHK